MTTMMAIGAGRLRAVRRIHRPIIRHRLLPPDPIFPDLVAEIRAAAGPEEAGDGGKAGNDRWRREGAGSKTG